MIEPEASPETHHRTLPVVEIRPRRGRAPIDLPALWQYRELLYFLTWRDIKVRYRQTFFGAAWAVIQPLVTMVVFSVVFGRLAGIPSDGVPYPVFAFAALVPWTFFSTGVTQASNSLVGGQNLREEGVLPAARDPDRRSPDRPRGLSRSLAIVLIALMLGFGIVPGLTTVWVVPLAVLAFVTALGVGLWLAALNVRYRDVRYVVPFLLQVWLFATPVAYPSSLLDEPWRTLYALNPMVGVVEGSRWALLGTATAPGPFDPGVERGRRAPPRDRAVVLPARREHASRTSSDGRSRSTSMASARSTCWVARSATRRCARLCRRPPGGSGRWPPVDAREPTTGAVLGAARRVVRDRRRARSSASSAPTAPARARCSRSCRGSPSPTEGARSSTAASVRCSRSARASTPS